MRKVLELKPAEDGEIKNRLMLELKPDGTLVSAFTVLCGARTDLPDRHMCCVFWLNIAAALIQILTAIVMVGWIMSIFWGMDMVILASYKEQGIPQQL
ncbi:putative membrane protein C1orf95 [Anas platyrhynchos]|uniref:Putative membrane protein C1orf95 n=1 Tax=Anas platyrhynchos TaxID=8839 RepID=R0JPN5_ANAPL|nr:putative membrane protein C1orf95 [Anas platyrhynchos]